MTELPEPRATLRTPGGRIDVRGPDELGAAVQLAARWAEMFLPPGSAEDQVTWLQRFRSAYAYLDAVIHGLEPPSPTT